MTRKIRIDGERCRGHGICALLMSGHVDLDEWGYPQVDSAEVAGRRASRAARRAARACPRQALHVQEVPDIQDAHAVPEPAPRTRVRPSPGPAR